MKAKFITTFATLAAMALGAVSCSDDVYKPETEERGKLNTSSIIPEVANAEIIISDQQGTKKSMSRRSYPLDDFIITIENSLGETVNEWTYSSMPSLPDFPVGTYTIKVASQEEVPSAWEAPLFLGQASFDIKKGEITELEAIVCRLANICVSVTYSDELIAASAGDISVTVTAKDLHQLVFSADETRRGYFQAFEGLNTLEVHFTGTINGVAEDFRYVLKEVAAGQHRKVAFTLRDNNNVPPDETGTITPGDGQGINVNTTITGNDLAGDTPWEETIIKDGDRPGKEDWGGDEPGPGPDVPEDWIIDFTSETLDPAGVNEAKGWTGDAIVVITSSEGVASLMVEIISDNATLSDEALRSIGLAGTFDLATAQTPDGIDLEEGLRGLGFAVKDEVVGHTTVNFNITEFIPMLAGLDGNHNFKITVTDQKGNSKDMTLKFKS
jgi:hypothetical protein BACCOPRO_03651